MEGWLRIYFEENAYTTVPAALSTSAGSICLSLARKKGLAPSVPTTLFVTDVSNHDCDVFERPLAHDECPLQVQEKCRKNGQLDQFKIIFRTVSGSGSTGGAGEHDFFPLSGSASPAPVDDSPSVDPRDSGVASPTVIDEEVDYISPSPSQLTFSASSRSLLQPSMSQTAMAADSSIIRCGYLEKRGKRNTAWKERWFALKADGLHYYKGHAATVPISSILLDDAFIQACHVNCQNSHSVAFVAAPSIANLTLSPALAQPHAHSSVGRCSYEFEIHTVARVYFVRARSYPEMLDWMRDIERVLPPCPENDLIDEIQTRIEEAEYVASGSDDASLLSLASLGGLLANGIGVEQLVQFETRRERGAERAVLAYLEAETFARAVNTGSKTKDQLLSRAQSIYDTFLAPHASQQVSCVSDARRHEVESALAKRDLHATLFTSVQASLFQYLSEHSFPAFVMSKHFQRAAQKLSVLHAQGGGSGSMSDTQQVTYVTPATNSASVSASPPEGRPLRVNSHSNSSSGRDSKLGGSTTIGPYDSASSGGDDLLPPERAVPSPPPSQVEGAGPAPMSPASLARYLESVGQVDAIKRSESIAVEGGRSSIAPSTMSHNNATHSRASADSDTDESEAEEVEEESIFAKTTTGSTSSAGGDADVFNISATRSRSVESVSRTPNNGPVSGGHSSSLASISETNVRMSESVINESTRPRQSESHGGSSDLTSTGSSSEPRVMPLGPRSPVEVRRRSSALTSSNVLTPVPVPTSASASAKWKSRSIFDADEEDTATPVITRRTSHAPPPRPQPTTTQPPSASPPHSNSRSIDLAQLDEEAVDLADLNLDEGGAEP